MCSDDPCINAKDIAQNISHWQPLFLDMSMVNSSFRVLQYVSFKTLFGFLLFAVPAFALMYLAL